MSNKEVLLRNFCHQSFSALSFFVQLGGIEIPDLRDILCAASLTPCADFAYRTTSISNLLIKLCGSTQGLPCCKLTFDTWRPNVDLGTPCFFAAFSNGIPLVLTSLTAAFQSKTNISKLFFECIFEAFDNEETKNQ